MPPVFAQLPFVEYIDQVGIAHRIAGGIRQPGAHQAEARRGGGPGERGG